MVVGVVGELRNKFNFVVHLHVQVQYTKPAQIITGTYPKPKLKCFGNTPTLGWKRKHSMLSQDLKLFLLHRYLCYIASKTSDYSYKDLLTVFL